MTIHYLDPNTNINTLWKINSYSNISKGTRYNTVPSLGTYIYADGKDDNKKQQYGFNTTGLSSDTTYNSITTYIYYEDQSDQNGMDVEIYLGGSWIPVGLDDSSPYLPDWYYGSVAGTYTQADIDNIEIRLDSSSGRGSNSLYVYQVYLSVNSVSPITSNMVGDRPIFISRIFRGFLTTDQGMKELC